MNKIKNTASNTPIISSRKKRAILDKAQEFAQKAHQHYNPKNPDNRELSEFYMGCVYGVSSICKILSIDQEQIAKIQEELNRKFFI